MDTEAISKEILAIRKRLGEIGTEHDGLGDDELEARVDLADERHELEARLAELRGKLSDPGSVLDHKSLEDAEFEALPNDGLMTPPEVH